jgi:hypothetical protein
MCRIFFLAKMTFHSHGLTGELAEKAIVEGVVSRLAGAEAQRSFASPNGPAEAVP